VGVSKKIILPTRNKGLAQYSDSQMALNRKRQGANEEVVYTKQAVRN